MTTELDKCVNNLAEELTTAARNLARQRFHEGRFDNPYRIGRNKVAAHILIAEFYFEMQGLLNERICPCCGQPTRGDIDW